MLHCMEAMERYYNRVVCASLCYYSKAQAAKSEATKLLVASSQEIIITKSKLDKILTLFIAVFFLKT